MRTPYRPMGFALSPLPSSPPQGQVEASFPPFSPLIADVLYTFDSGHSLSHHDGAGNTIIFGSTGRGKTADLVNPCVNSLVKSGFGGIIIDVKGSCTDTLRLLARNAGREADILELGTADTATPINLLQGLTMQDIQRFLNAAVVDGVKHSTHNLDWTQRGIKMTMDMVQLLFFLKEYDDSFIPTLSMLKTLTHNYNFAHNLYLYFLRDAFDETRADHEDFVAEMAGKTMHPLHEKTDDEHWLRQSEWNIQDTANALSSMVSDEKIKRNFATSSPSAMSLDFGKLVYEQKCIIVLRFDPESAAAGTKIARFIKEKFYQDAYKYGKKQPECEYTFAVMDEFQDIVCLDYDNAMNDSAWLAKSREFRNINVMATQSIAALHEHAPRDKSVDALLTNCSTKIVLQVEDPTTINYFKTTYNNADLDPSCLEIGKCLLFSYSQDTHDLTKYVDSMQDEYNKIVALLKNMEELDSPTPAPTQPQEPQGESPHPSGLPRALVRVIMGEPDRYADEAPSGATGRTIRGQETVTVPNSALEALRQRMADNDKIIKKNSEIIAKTGADMGVIFAEDYEVGQEEIAEVLKNTDNALELLGKCIAGSNEKEAMEQDWQRIKSRFLGTLKARQAQAQAGFPTQAGMDTAKELLERLINGSSTRAQPTVDPNFDNGTILTATARIERAIADNAAPGRSRSEALSIAKAKACEKDSFAEDDFELEDLLDAADDLKSAIRIAAQDQANKMFQARIEGQKPRPAPWIPSPSALVELEAAKAKAIARIEARRAREDAARAALRFARRARPGRPVKATRPAPVRLSRPEKEWSR